MALVFNLLYICGVQIKIKPIYRALDSLDEEIKSLTGQNDDIEGHDQDEVSIVKQNSTVTKKTRDNQSAGGNHMKFDDQGGDEDDYSEIEIKIKEELVKE